TLDVLPDGGTVGTSSRRRAAQLLARRPDLHIVDLRGNVDTRIRKALADDGPYDAIVLAHAGLARLGHSDVISQVLPLDVMLPAPAQGALGIQCRDEAVSLDLLAPLNHAATRQAVEAERAFLVGLGGGCSVPIAAFATLDGDRVFLRGRVSAVDGSRQIDVSGTIGIGDAARLGHDLARQALTEGAGELLAAAEGAVA
ncbi:MAG: hydroxymethylbilane synthase, partial [Anaerolineae bacterium]|nr:hydroxymethylbilane synthase [Anaerolineae bacterium]